MQGKEVLLVVESNHVSTELLGRKVADRDLSKEKVTCQPRDCRTTEPWSAIVRHFQSSHRAQADVQIRVSSLQLT